MKRVLYIFSFLIFSNSIMCAPNDPQPKNSFLMPFSIGIVFSVGLFLLYRCFWSSNKKSADNNTQYFSHSNTPLIQGSGQKAEKRVSLNAPINEIMMQCAGNMGVFLGETDNVIISADDNIIDLLEARQDAAKLDCKYTCANINISPKIPISFLVQITKQSLLKLITAQGTGSVRVNDGVLWSNDSFTLQSRDTGSIAVACTNNMNATNVLIDVKDSSKVKLPVPIICTDFQVFLRDSGNLELHEITAKDFTTKISDSGKCVTNNVVAQNAVMNISDSGSLNLNGLDVKDLLDSKITDSGRVHIPQGSIERANITVSDSGFFNAQKVAINNHCYAKISDSGRVQCNPKGTITRDISDSGTFNGLGKEKKRKERKRKKSWFD